MPRQKEDLARKSFRKERYLSGGRALHGEEQQAYALLTEPASGSKVVVSKLTNAAHPRVDLRLDHYVLRPLKLQDCVGPAARKTLLDASLNGLQRLPNRQAGERKHLGCHFGGAPLEEPHKSVCAAILLRALEHVGHV